MEMISYLEADKERLFQSLAQNEAPEQAAAVVESEVDRLLLQYNESCGDDREQDAALHMLQAVKSTLPLLCAQAEPRVWERNEQVAGPEAGKARMTLPAWISLLAGAALCVGAMAAMLAASGGVIAPIVFLKALPIALVGCALTFLGGRLSGRPAGKKAKTAGAGAEDDALDRRIEMRADPDKIWSCLRASILVTDRNLKEVRDKKAAEQRADRVANGSGLSGEEVKLLSGLLELAYSQRQEKQSAMAAQEMIDDIRFYLHKTGTEVVDYTRETKKEHGDWFERLPASSGGLVTLRPALVQEGTLLRKGMAADAG